MKCKRGLHETKLVALCIPCVSDHIDALLQLIESYRKEIGFYPYTDNEIYGMDEIDTLLNVKNLKQAEEKYKEFINGTTK